MRGTRAQDRALKRGREARNRVMRDRCRIERPGDRKFNDATGEYDYEPSIVIYEGPCQFKQYGTEGIRFGDGGGERELTTMDAEIIIPWDSAADVDVTDVVYLTRTDDPVAAGKLFTVESTQFGGDRTGRHIFINHQDPGEVKYG